MPDEHVTKSTKWERYDLACSGLSIMIGHYSELIHHEENRPTPDTLKINAWVGLQDELCDLEMMLSVDDLKAVEKINVAHGSAVSAILKIRM
jgi:hypothetical protein